MSSLRIVIALTIILSSVAGCTDRFDEGYRAGYADGLSVGEQTGLEKAAAQFERQSQTTTEICGGAGANVNGKYVPGGKTGCVRIFSDGTVERY